MDIETELIKYGYLRFVLASQQHVVELGNNSIGYQRLRAAEDALRKVYVADTAKRLHALKRSGVIDSVIAAVMQVEERLLALALAPRSKTKAKDVGFEMNHYNGVLIELADATESVSDSEKRKLVAKVRGGDLTSSTLAPDLMEYGVTSRLWMRILRARLLRSPCGRVKMRAMLNRCAHLSMSADAAV